MAKGCVLVADDDPAIVGVLTSALEDEGYRVVTTMGADTLRLAIILRPDVVLLDISMPGMDGVEVCQRLHQNPATAHIPVILMTARHDLSALARGAKADSALTKPFDLEELYATVERVAGSR